MNYEINLLHHVGVVAETKKNTVQALKYPSAHAVTLYTDICQVSRQLIENKNDLLKLIKINGRRSLVFSLT